MDADPDQPNNMSWDDWVEDFMFDDLEERHLHLTLELYGQSTSSKLLQFLHRNCKARHKRLVKDDFASNPVYQIDEG